MSSNNDIKLLVNDLDYKYLSCLFELFCVDGKPVMKSGKHVWISSNPIFYSNDVYFSSVCCNCNNTTIIGFDCKHTFCNDCLSYNNFSQPLCFKCIEKNNNKKISNLYISDYYVYLYFSSDNLWRITIDIKSSILPKNITDENAWLTTNSDDPINGCWQSYNDDTDSWSYNNKILLIGCSGLGRNPNPFINTDDNKIFNLFY